MQQSVEKIKCTSAWRTFRCLFSVAKPVKLLAEPKVVASSRTDLETRIDFNILL